MESLPATRSPANVNRKPLPPVEVTGRLVTGSGQSLHDLFHGCAILEVESEGRQESYWVSLHVSPDGHIEGLRLQKFATGQRYDLPADLSECDCPDHQYRGRECKHMTALRQALVSVARDNPPPKRVSRRALRDEATQPPAV